MTNREHKKLLRAIRHQQQHRDNQTLAKKIDRAFTRLSEGCSKRVVRAVAASAVSQQPDYRQQLESRADALERSQKRIAYKDTNPLGNKIHAVQRMKLSSKPLI